MKKITFVLFLCLFPMWVLTGCSGKKSAEAEGVSLTAPNGEMIAGNMDELNDKTMDVVSEQFGENMPFEITSVEYADVKDGYLAVVSYRLESGEVSNYALSNSYEVIAATGLKTFQVETMPANIPDGKDGFKQVEISSECPVFAYIPGQDSSGVASLSVMKSEDGSLKLSCDGGVRVVVKKF